MPKKIVLAGGSGFIGGHLKKYYQMSGYQVLVISRKQGDVHWENQQAIINALENAELVVNLAGKSVDCRYTAKNKAMIFSSRLETTHKLGEAILACSNPPKLWINSSTATLYRHAEDQQMTETSGEIGTGFSVEVGKAWEREFFSFKLPATRQVALRIAIVLGPDGGALLPYAKLAKWGLGGAQGNGRQMFSWLHIEDMVRIISFVEQHPVEGVFNAAAPVAVTNRRFMQLLYGRIRIKMPFRLPAPAFLIRLGAGIIGTSSELLLKSRWVYPENLLAQGFVFQYPRLEEALDSLLEGS